MAPQIDTRPAYCAEKQSLTELFLEAVRDIIQLENAEMEAVVQGKPRLERFDLALTVARDKRDKAKLAFLLHVQGHGC